jgi:hypothetical protein
LKEYYRSGRRARANRGFSILGSLKNPPQAADDMARSSKSMINAIRLDWFKAGW